MALRSLWGQCVPHVLLAGALTGHGHGYGLGTTLLHGRHPEPGIQLLLAVSECALHVMKAHCRRVFQCKCYDAGDTALLPPAEEALRKVHRCSILVNDLHPNNYCVSC